MWSTSVAVAYRQGVMSRTGGRPIGRPYRPCSPSVFQSSSSVPEYRAKDEVQLNATVQPASKAAAAGRLRGNRRATSFKLTDTNRGPPAQGDHLHVVGPAVRLRSASIRGRAKFALVFAIAFASRTDLSAGGSVRIGLATVGCPSPSVGRNACPRVTSTNSLSGSIAAGDSSDAPAVP
jgi:hypothetical protein